MAATAADDSATCPRCKKEILANEVGSTGVCPFCGAEVESLVVYKNASKQPEVGKGAHEFLVKVKRKDSLYEAYISNLGLLEGEEEKIELYCAREAPAPPSSLRITGNVEVKDGLLVFTNDNLIFMQRDGIFHPTVSQALRIPLEQITGVVSGGTLTQHIRINVGPQMYEFIPKKPFMDRDVHEVKQDIERLLKDVREERRQMAQRAVQDGGAPQVIFCKYCGARNKSDQTKCVNCSALI